VRGSALPRLLLGIAVVVGLPGCGSAAEDGARVVVVRNGTLIDGTGAAPRSDVVIVIEDGRIRDVGAETDVAVPSGAVVVDAQGGTILPGLVDTHTHLLNGLLSSTGELSSSSVAYYLESTLDAGVTTFRDAGSAVGHTASLSDFRTALDALEVPLPTIVVTGPIIAAEGNLAVSRFAGQAVAVADVTAAEAAVNRLLDSGVDQIKIMVDHWESAGEPTPSLTDQQIAAITRATHDRDAWVLAHVTDIADARAAIEGGVDELTHWPGHERLPDDLIQEIVDKDVPIGTTYGIPDVFPADGDVRRLLDAGGRIVISTDAPGVMPIRDLWRELVRMVQAGMTPMEAIIASTRDAARTLGLQDVGTIEVGMAADLVIVDGNPLDSMSAIGDVTNVIKNGVTAYP